MTQRIGILGLGAIGRVVAGNLRADGFAVTAVRRPEALDFPDLAETAAALARDSEIVVSALATEAQMRSAFLGPDGLVAGAHERLAVVDLGTFPVALKQEIAAALEARGARMLDAPISGTPPVVAARKAVLFVSGTDADVARCKPVLAAISPGFRHVGPFGRGMAMKFVANFLVMVHTLATAEAMRLGTRAGLDPNVLTETIGASFAGSPVFSFRAPMMAARTYRPAHGPARIMWKDLQYIHAESARLGLEGPLLDTAMTWFRQLVESGLGDDEGAAVYELLLGAAERR